MKKSIIATDHTMKELADHGTPEYPILTLNDVTLSHSTGFVSWHWHKHFELTYIQAGHFEFSTGPDTFTLGPGEAVFINSQVLHQVKPYKGENPVYHSYTFAPELLSESMQSLIAAKYLLPLMNNSNFPYYIFTGKASWENQCLEHICLLNRASASGDFSRELKVVCYLQTVLIDMIDHLGDICKETQAASDSEHFIIIKIMGFIQEHYNEALSLSDMADSANISKSTLGRLFHKTLKITPFAYLLNYRINQSTLLLKNPSQTITDIALSCGFHDVSYYCKAFRKYKGMSPKQYRQKVCDPMASPGFNTQNSHADKKPNKEDENTYLY